MHMVNGMQYRKKGNTVFPLISALAAYLISNLSSAKITGVRHLKERGTYCKVRGTLSI